MPLTKTGQITLRGTGIILGLALAGVVAYTAIQNSLSITTLANRPIPVITKTIVVTPTAEPTATPSAALKPRIIIATPKVTLHGVR